MEWIVFDYAGVVGLPPSEADAALLPAALNCGGPEFWAAYRAERESYDLGLVDAAGYWSCVCDRLGRRANLALAETLTDLDMAMWGRPDPAVVALLEDLAAAGRPLALLSNAPAELARLVEARPFAALFGHRLFSCDLGLVKPDPKIFEHLSATLASPPEDLVFVDDRTENVESARSLGLAAVLFTGAGTLRTQLTSAVGA